MNPSEILEAAKKHLWNGYSHSPGTVSYVCSAIDIAVPIHTLGVSDSLRKLNYHITDLLDGLGSLSEWLYREHGIDPYYDTTKMQATRLAWMNDMIAYFKSKGE